MSTFDIYNGVTVIPNINFVFSPNHQYLNVIKQINVRRELFISEIKERVL